MFDYCQITTAELLLHATAINMGTGEDDDEDTDGTTRHGRESHPAGKGLDVTKNKKTFNKPKEPSMNDHYEVSERAK